MEMYVCGTENYLVVLKLNLLMSDTGSFIVIFFNPPEDLYFFGKIL